MTSSSIGSDTDVSSTRLLKVVEVLAGQQFAGRRVGTSGGSAAGVWLADQLRVIGAVVASDQFPVHGVRELYRTPELEWDDGTRTHRLTHRRDFVEHLASAELATPRTGGLVTSGGGRVADCWVLAPSADPQVLAENAAAAGLLVPRGTDEAGWMPKMLAGPPVGELPVLAVRTDLHQAMSGGTRVTASMPLRTVAVTGTNIHGVLRESTPDELNVLLTAHYDGVGDDPEQRLPAAADNASGVAVVLEAARALAALLPIGVGLAVAFLDAEEAGAQGSAQHAPRVTPGTHVINVDGAAQLADAAAVEAGGPAHQLLAALDQAGRRTGVPLRAGAMPSDNRRYASVGLPAIGIGMGIPGYQTPAETPDRVEPATLLAATRLVIETVGFLADR
ncbi:MAG: M28 family peptidase [Kibdelosporangium sp.]